MWRRSWLSREVLLFTLFLLALTATTLAQPLSDPPPTAPGIAAKTGMAGGGAWSGGDSGQRIHLPCAGPPFLEHAPYSHRLCIDWSVSRLPARRSPMRTPTVVHCKDAASRATLHPPCWLATRLACRHLRPGMASEPGVRLHRLRGSALFEARATFSLLSSDLLRPRATTSFILVPLSVLILATGHPVPALAVGCAGALLARYLFFVSVVPLNMALTFVRTRSA